MARSTGEDAQALLRSLRSAYAATPKNLKVVYMALVGSFPFNSFLSGVLSCVGTAVLSVCLPPYPVEEGKQGIQGFGTRTCFCRFCSLQLGTSFSDHEFPWLKLRHVGSSSPSYELSGYESSLFPFNLGSRTILGT